MPEPTPLESTPEEQEVEALLLRLITLPAAPESLDERVLQVQPQPHAEEAATESELRQLLTLPSAPRSMDTRILAAARAHAMQADDAAPADDPAASDTTPTSAPAAPAPRGRTILFPMLGRVAAAALILIAAGFGARFVTPGAALPSGELPAERLALSAQVVEAEGAFGEGALPKLGGARVSSGEPLAIKPGGFLRLRLAEGTELMLDGGSRGSLSFGQRERRLELSAGRLYAKVVKVGTTFEKRPLVVATQGGRARVLGTELTVSAEGKRARVTVREGTVRLENDHGLSLVGASESGLLVRGGAPTTRPLSSVDRQFRWIGKIQAGERHPAERPFGGVVSEGEPAIGTLTATLPSGEQTLLALASQQVETRIEDGLAHTTVAFAFRNTTDTNLEGTFRFALPKAASVVRYAVTTHGELQEGRVIEREEARAIYAEQKERLEQPALLEWSQGNAFTAKVFPIEAGGLKHIEIGYSEVLPERHGVSRMVLPLVSEAAKTHPPERLTVSVHVRGPEAEAALRCPSHFVRARREAGGLTVSLDATDLRPRNDFVLEMSRAGAPIVVGRVEEAPNSEPDSVLVRIRPDLSWLADRVAQGPLVVLCDGSASQTGTYKEVQLELLEALLEDADRRARVFVAHTELEELQAEGPARLDGLLGELWRSRVGGAQDLAHAFTALGRALPPDAGATLVYLGDGSATTGVRDAARIAAVFERALPEETVRRCITVGIGANLEQALLERLARERAGVHVGVRPGDDLGSKLDEVVGAVREPVLTQVAVDLELDGVHEVHPTVPSNLRPGEVLDLSARLRGDARDGFVTIRGVAAGHPFEARAPLRLQPSRGNRLDALWARRRIADLLERPGTEDEVTDLALYHGLVSPYTSLLVLTDEEYERAVQRRLEAQAPAVEALLAQGIRALGQAQTEEAQGFVNRALRKQPGNERAIQLLERIDAVRETMALRARQGLIGQPGASELLGDDLAGEDAPPEDPDDLPPEDLPPDEGGFWFDDGPLALALPEDTTPGRWGERMRINVDVESTDLADVVEHIGRQAGRNILVDPSIEAQVRLSLRDMEWREAVDVIARMTQTEVEERPGGILLLTRREPEKKLVKVVEQLEKLEDEQKQLTEALGEYGRAKRLLPDSSREVVTLKALEKAQEQSRTSQTLEEITKKLDEGKGALGLLVDDEKQPETRKNHAYDALHRFVGGKPSEGDGKLGARRKTTTHKLPATTGDRYFASNHEGVRFYTTSKKPFTLSKVDELPPGPQPVGKSSGDKDAFKGEFYDANEINKRAAEYPAPKLGLDPPSLGGGGGGAAGGTLSFDRNADDKPWPKGVTASTYSLPLQESNDDRRATIARQEIAEGQVARLKNLTTNLEGDLSKLREERAAIAALRELKTSQALFREADKSSGENLDYGNLDELAKPGTTGLIDQVLGSGTKNGYVFEAQPGEEATSFAWSGEAADGTVGFVDGSDASLAVNGTLSLGADATRNVTYRAVPLAATYAVSNGFRGEFTNRLLRLDAASATERPVLFDELLNVLPALRSSDVAMAVRVARRLRDYAPQRLDVHEQLGLSWQAMGQRREALRAFSGLVEAQPDSAEARWRYARALLGLELPRRALVEAREACRLRPDVASYRIGRAELALRLGRLAEAERVLRGVLATNFHPEQGDVSVPASRLLDAVFVARLRQTSGRSAERAVQAREDLRAGLFMRRAVRVRLEGVQGHAQLLVTAPEEAPVTADVPLSAAGGRLAGETYTHTGPAAGTWTVAIRAPQGETWGTLVVTSREGTSAQRVRRLPFRVAAGQTQRVFTGAVD